MPLSFHSRNNIRPAAENEYLLGTRMEFPHDVPGRLSKPPLHPELSTNRAPPVSTRGRVTFRDFNDTRTIPARQTPNGQSTTKRTIKGRCPQPRGAAPPLLLSPEQKQLQELYLDARRHEAIVARVTTQSDFQKLSYTLPAAKHGTNAYSIDTVMRGPSLLREGACLKAARASAAANLILSQSDSVYDYRHHPTKKTDKQNFTSRDCHSFDSGTKLPKGCGWRTILSWKFPPRSSMMVTPIEI